MISVVDLTKPRRFAAGRAVDLRDVLAQILGEPFLFARLGYADELTLHFGTRHLADNQRLRAKGVEYGSHILAVGGSAWVLKSTPRMRLILEGLPGDKLERDNLIRPVAGADIHEELAAHSVFTAGVPVTVATPYEMTDPGGIGLRVETADGSGVFVVPSLELDPDTNEPVDFPDWELRTPAGLARVGPGFKWTWEPNESWVKDLKTNLKPRL